MQILASRVFVPLCKPHALYNGHDHYIYTDNGYKHQFDDSE